MIMKIILFSANYACNNISRELSCIMGDFPESVKKKTWQRAQQHLIRKIEAHIYGAVGTPRLSYPGYLFRWKLGGTGIY